MRRSPSVPEGHRGALPLTWTKVLFGSGKFLRTCSLASPSARQLAVHLSETDVLMSADEHRRMAGVGRTRSGAETAEIANVDGLYPAEVDPKRSLGFSQNGH